MFPNRNQGFSVIELLVVLVILSMISLLAVPQFKKMIHHYALKNGILQLENDLKTARGLARQKGLLYKTVLQIGTSRYQIFRQDISENRWVLEKVSEPLPYDVVIKQSTLANQQVIFGQDGTPYEDPQTDPPLESRDNPFFETKTITLVSGELEKNIMIEKSGVIQNNLKSQ